MTSHDTETLRDGLLTSDDVHHHPVRGGEGGDAGVVTRVLGLAVPHCQPALHTDSQTNVKTSGSTDGFLEVK